MLNFVGDKRTRTADICLAKAALYQLSYTPKCCYQGVTYGLWRAQEGAFWQMGYPGVEPGTSPLSGVRSNQLS